MGYEGSVRQLKEFTGLQRRLNFSLNFQGTVKHRLWLGSTVLFPQKVDLPPMECNKRKEGKCHAP